MQNLSQMSKDYNNKPPIKLKTMAEREPFNINNEPEPLPEPCQYCGKTAYITKNIWPETACSLCCKTIGLISNKDYQALKKHLKLIKDHEQPLTPKHLEALSHITGIKQVKLLALLYPLKYAK